MEGVDLKGSAMTNRSPNAVRSLVALRRLARGLRGVGLSAAWVVGVGATGAVVFGGAGAIVITGLWAWLYPELRRVKTFSSQYLDEQAAREILK